MKRSTNQAPAVAQDGVRWRKSSFSPDSQCVEVADLSAEIIAVRNSNDREAGTLHLTRAEFGAWLRGCKAGEFDDLS